MSKISRIIVKTCFWIWAVHFLMPAILRESLARYQPLAILIRIGGYLNSLVTVLAVIAFLSVIWISLFKKNPVSHAGHHTLILHDLEDEAAGNLLDPKTAGFPVRFFCAAKKKAACKGYYDCWLKNPGICSLRDGTENLGHQISTCDELIIISQNLYGGFSKDIKRALDRSISGVLPFFRFSHHELHHQPRQRHGGKLKVYAYHADGISETDQHSIREMAKAVGINLNINCEEVIFLQDKTELENVEMIKLR